MNINLIAGLLLASVALTSHAGETSVPAAPADHASAAAEAGNPSAGDATATRIHFGTNLTDAVIIDISSRIAQDLAAKMAVELKNQGVPGDADADSLLVSTH